MSESHGAAHDRTHRALILFGIALLVLGLALILVPPTVQVGGGSTRCESALLLMTPNDPTGEPPTAAQQSCTDAMLARVGAGLLVGIAGAALVATGAILRHRQRSSWWHSIQPPPA
jgi:drug/metabolite transporter (DMT)-like permease